ncbi:GNAT family N-acetyltransferase [soil metagenome]
MAVHVRPAISADLPTIKAIYDDQVRTGISTFDVEPPPLSRWEERLADADHLLVAEDDGAVLGYAFSSTYRPRPAYDRTRECSVYISTEARGRGLARTLYDELLARLRADRVHTALAVIARPNPGSEALHSACGFTLVGVLPEVGRKFDRWIDTGFWALVLADDASEAHGGGAEGDVEAVAPDHD